MRSSGSRSALEVERLSKHYGAVSALDGVSLAVGAGEFLTLLGPSGSGKTTLLMAVAGFVQPSSGTISLDGQPITHLPPERRKFGMVFQGYALFPHLTVARNVAFPLEIRGRPKAEIDREVARTLALVQLEHLAGRLPRQLSGGQQQRVALARALIFEPHLLLLDEPLSALDKKLRIDLQLELKTLHRKVGRTFIYVTHDQDEALSMSDRIAIMRDGRIIQAGAPKELYERPSTRFVAGFLGRSNFVEGRVEGRSDGEIGYRTADGRLFRSAVDSASAPIPGQMVVAAIRPEKMRLVAPGETAANRAAAQVLDFSYLGTSIHLVAAVPGLGDLTLTLPARRLDAAPELGSAVTVGWDPDGSTLVENDMHPATAEAA